MPASAKKPARIFHFPLLRSLISLRLSIQFIRKTPDKQTPSPVGGFRSSTYFLEVIGDSFPFAEGPGLWALLGATLGAWDRLWVMCALTRWPAARAEQSESSPARTPAATILASCWAFLPGVVGWAPRTPRRSSMAAWGSRMVPPPMVPTSIEGMETEIWRFPLRLWGVHC